MSGDRHQPPRALGCLLLVFLAAVTALLVVLVVAVFTGSGDAGAWAVIVLAASALVVMTVRREADRRSRR